MGAPNAMTIAFSDANLSSHTDHQQYYSSSPIPSYELGIDQIPTACPNHYGVICCHDSGRYACNLVPPLESGVVQYLWGIDSGDRGKFLSKCIIEHYLTKNDIKKSGKTIAELIHILHVAFFEEAIITMPKDGGRLEKKVIRGWIRKNLRQIT